MESEKMKSLWDEFSHRLERQQIVSHKTMEDSIMRHRNNLNAFLRLNIVSSLAAIPLCIGIALWRGLIGQEFLWIGLVGLIIYLLIELYKASTFRSMECNAKDIARQERLSIRYRQLQMGNTVFGYTFVSAFTAWIVLSRWNAFESGRLTILLTAIALVFIGSAYAYRWEKARFGDLRKAEKELREFMAE